VHIVSLNTNLDYSTESKQYAWLKQDLETSKEKWKIVLFHHPPFSSGEHGGDTAVAAALSPLFETNGVDLVLNGHDHVYERNQEINGVDYIVTGGGGRATYSRDTLNPYSKVFASENHFVGLKVYPDKISVRAIDKRGYEIDAYTIK
jgi:3',5'-cyclic AMP phosphodiesterase CpdA